MDQARRVWLWQTEGAREAPVDRGLLVVGHLVKIYTFFPSNLRPALVKYTLFCDSYCLNNYMN